MSYAALAGMAASAAGGIIQAIAADRARREMNQQFQAEVDRQNLLRNEAMQKFTEYIPTRGVETARQELAQGKGEREAGYGRVGKIPLTAGMIRGFGPTARDNAWYGMTGGTRANLGSYNDWQLNQMISQIRAQDEVNRISDAAHGWARVFPFRMQDAQHSQDALAGAGMFIGGLGGGAQGYSQLFGLGQQAQPTSSPVYANAFGAYSINPDNSLSARRSPWQQALYDYYAGQYQ